MNTEINLQPISITFVLSELLKAEKSAFSYLHVGQECVFFN